MSRPRTSPLQKYPTRPARAKHSLKSKIASNYATRGHNPIPGYLTTHFPKQSRATYKAMENAIERYMSAYPDMPIPSPVQCRILFEGLID